MTTTRPHTNDHNTCGMMTIYNILHKYKTKTNEKRKNHSTCKTPPTNQQLAFIIVRPTIAHSEKNEIKTLQIIYTHNIPTVKIQKREFIDIYSPFNLDNKCMKINTPDLTY